MGWIRATPEKERTKRYLKPTLAQPLLGLRSAHSLSSRDQPNPFWAKIGLVSWVGPAHIYLIYIFFMIYIIILYKTNSKNPFKKL